MQKFTVGLLVLSLASPSTAIAKSRKTSEAGSHHPRPAEYQKGKGGDLPTSDRRNDASRNNASSAETRIKDICRGC
jgi:hypothetical protein